MSFTSVRKTVRFAPTAVALPPPIIPGFMANTLRSYLGMVWKWRGMAVKTAPLVVLTKKSSAPSPASE